MAGLSFVRKNCILYGTGNMHGEREQDEDSDWNKKEQACNGSDRTGAGYDSDEVF